MLYFRKNIRLKNYNYSTCNYYFVTICTHNRQNLFLPHLDPKFGFKLNITTSFYNNQNVAAPLCGDNLYYNNRNVTAPLCGANTTILLDKIKQIPGYYTAEVDFYCLMPNHLHLIIYLSSNNKTPLWLIIKAFKDWTTRKIKKAAQSAAATNSTLLNKSTATQFYNTKLSIWQPNYYEHIIRSEKSLEKIRKYIANNPFVEYEDINWRYLDPNI